VVFVAVALTVATPVFGGALMVACSAGLAYLGLGTILAFSLGGLSAIVLALLSLMAIVMVFAAGIASLMTGLRRPAEPSVQAGFAIGERG
jgi:hypothetical protein